MHAFITIWPSCIEFRGEDGKWGTQPLVCESVPREQWEQFRWSNLGLVLDTLARTGYTSIELRVENADD